MFSGATAEPDHISNEQTVTETSFLGAPNLLGADPVLDMVGLVHGVALHSEKITKGDYRTMANGNRITGTVKWFKEQKGFGFIRRHDGEPDVFVHYSSITGQGFKTLNEGDKVVFDVERGDKGDKAVNVSRV